MVAAVVKRWARCAIAARATRIIAGFERAAFAVARWAVATRCATVTKGRAGGAIAKRRTRTTVAARATRSIATRGERTAFTITGRTNPTGRATIAKRRPRTTITTRATRSITARRVRPTFTIGRRTITARRATITKGRTRTTVAAWTTRSIATRRVRTTFTIGRTITARSTTIPKRRPGPAISRATRVVATRLERLPLTGTRRPCTACGFIAAHWPVAARHLGAYGLFPSGSAAGTNGGTCRRCRARVLRCQFDAHIFSGCDRAQQFGFDLDLCPVVG